MRGGPSPCGSDLLAYLSIPRHVQARSWGRAHAHRLLISVRTISWVNQGLLLRLTPFPERTKREIASEWRVFYFNIFVNNQEFVSYRRKSNGQCRASHLPAKTHLVEGRLHECRTRVAKNLNRTKFLSIIQLSANDTFSKIADSNATCERNTSDDGCGEIAYG